MPYKELEDEAIADIAIAAEGKDLNELFAECARAYIEISVNPKTVGIVDEKTFTITEPTIEKLLFSFLEELIFIRDAEFMIFKQCTVAVTGEEGAYICAAKVFGEQINETKHELKNDIKAITLHMFDVHQQGKKWKAKFVFDI